jgi:hypothetical protein
MKQTFYIIRFHQNGSTQVIREGLTKKEALIHCLKPENNREGEYFDQWFKETKKLII